MLAREIVQFGAIGIQIVQLPGSLLGTNELPGALAQGTIGSKVKIQGIVLRPHLALENGNQGAPHQGIDFPSACLLWIGGLSQFECRGHDVDEVSGLIGGS